MSNETGAPHRGRFSPLTKGGRILPFPWDEISPEIRHMVLEEKVPIKLGMYPIHRELSRIAAYSLLRMPFEEVLQHCIPITHSLAPEDIQLVFDWHMRATTEEPVATLQFTGPVLEFPDDAEVGPPEIGSATPSPMVTVPGRSGIPMSDNARQLGAGEAARRAAQHLVARGDGEFPDGTYCALGPTAELSQSMSDEAYRRLRAFEYEYREALWAWRGTRQEVPPVAQPWNILRRYVSDAPYVSPHGVSTYALRFQESCEICRALYTREEIKIVTFLFNAVVHLWRGSVPIQQLAGLLKRAETICVGLYHSPLAETIARERCKLLEARKNASVAWGRRGIENRIRAREKAGKIE